MRTLLNDMRNMQAAAGTAEDSELPGMTRDYAALITKGEELVPKLRDAAIAVYKEAPNEDRQIKNWLSTIVADSVGDDRFEDAKPAVAALIERFGRSHRLQQRWNHRVRDERL